LKYFVVVLLLLSSTSLAFDLGFVITPDTVGASTDTTYASLSQTQKDIVDFYKTRMGYTVTVLTSKVAKEYSSAELASMFDGVYWTYSTLYTTITSLRDAAVGIVSGSQYAGSQLYLSSQHGHPFSVDAQQYVKDTTDDFYAVRYSMDTLYQSWGSGSAPEVLYSLASGVHPVWNFTRWKNTDTAVVAIADVGATLTTGTAPARRAYFGVLRDKEQYVGHQNMAECHFWEMLGNLSAWTFSDTSNETWESSVCYAGKDELEACWFEYGGTGRNETYASGVRFGQDPNYDDVYQDGDGITMYKIWPKALVKKLRSGYTTVLSCSLKTPKLLSLAIDHGTSGFDFWARSHKIIRTEKWYAPDPTEGGYGWWVNRTNMYKTSDVDSVLWNSPMLGEGTDYDATVLDSIHFSNSMSVYDSIFPVIPPAVVEGWIEDTSTCNGIVYVARKHDNACDSTWCDVEIATASCADQISNSVGGSTQVGSHIWWMNVQETQISHRVSCQDTIEITSLPYTVALNDTCYCMGSSSLTVSSGNGVSFNNRHDVLLTSKGATTDTIIVAQRQVSGVSIGGGSDSIHVKNLTIRIDSTKDTSTCIDLGTLTNIWIENCNLEPAGVNGRGVRNEANAYYFYGRVASILSDTSFTMSIEGGVDYDDSKFDHDGYAYAQFYTGDFVGTSKRKLIWNTQGGTLDTVYLRASIRSGTDTLVSTDSVLIMGTRRCGHDYRITGGTSKSLVSKFRYRCSHDGTVYVLEAGDDSVHTDEGEFFAKFQNVNVTTCPHVAIAIEGYRTPKVEITNCSLTVDSRNLLYTYVPNPSMCYTNGDAFALDLGGLGAGSVIDSNVIRSGDTYTGGQGMLIQCAKGTSTDSVEIAYNDIDVHQGANSAHAMGFGAGVYWRFVPGDVNTGSEYVAFRDNKIVYSYDVDTLTTAVGRSCEAVTLILSGGENQPADSFKYIDITRNSVEVKCLGTDTGGTEVVALGWGMNDSASTGTGGVAFNVRNVLLSGNHWKSTKTPVSLANRRGLPGNNLLMIGDTIEATASADSTIWFSQYGAWLYHSTNNRFRDCVFAGLASDSVRYSYYTGSNDSLGLSAKFERTLDVHVQDVTTHLPVLGALVRVVDSYGHTQDSGLTDVLGNRSSVVVYKFKGKDLKLGDLYAFGDSVGYNPFSIVASYAGSADTASMSISWSSEVSDTLQVGLTTTTKKYILWRRN